MIEVSRRLAPRHDITLLGFDWAEVKRIEATSIGSLLKGVKYYELPAVKLPRGVALPHPLYTWELLRRLSSFDLTYVLVPNPPFELLFYLLNGRPRTGLICGFHGRLRPDIRLQRIYSPFFRMSLRAFSGYHATNTDTYDWLKRAGFPNVFHVPNGVDTTLFQLCEDPDTFDSFRVLYVGRIDADKGVDMLLKTILGINSTEAIRDVRFDIVGSGPLAHLITELAGRYENVHYHGFRQQAEIVEFYRHSNLFLNTSKSEGMPLTLLEAQSCGLPVVAPFLPGISDLICDNRNGYLVKAYREDSFQEKIMRFYSLWKESASSYHALNRRIRESIVLKYDWGSIVNNLDAAFAECVNTVEGVRR